MNSSYHKKPSLERGPGIHQGTFDVCGGGGGRKTKLLFKRYPASGQTKNSIKCLKIRKIKKLEGRITQTNSQVKLEKLD